MKEIDNLSADVEKAIGDAVEADIAKVVEDEGVVEKDVRFFGVNLSKIFGKKRVHSSASGGKDGK